jgi:hypothetical protein
MGNFYFDESIHDNGKFITGCAIYSNTDINPIIESALLKLNLIPGIDEYKSRNIIAGNETNRLLRGEIYKIFCKYTQFGLVFIPRSEQKYLYINGLMLIEKIINNNNLEKEKHNVYFDDGILEFGNKKQVEGLTVYTKQNSKIIMGIQIADFVAHTCSIMLKEQLGLLDKYVKVGENSGYDPDMMMSIGFDLWTGIRHHFFQSQQGVDDERAFYGYTNISDYGLLISKSFDKKTYEAIEARFSTGYLGCIH